METVATTAYGRELIAALERAPLAGWEITRLRQESYQLYLVFDQVESLRRVVEEKYRIKIYLEVAGGQERRLGESGWTANPGDDIAGALAQALERAALVANPWFTLPAPPQDYPSLPLADQTLQEQPEAALWRLRHELVQAVAVEPQVDLAAAEIFLQPRRIAYLNSLQLAAACKETVIQVQFALLASGGGEEAESLGWRQGTSLSSLDLQGLVARYSRYARDQLRAELPPRGHFPVLLGEEALDHLFDYLVAQASGEAVFQGWSRLRPGAPVIREPQGDLLTLTSDPWLPGGCRTRPFDEHGLALKPVTFIADNIFRQTLADKRYADYLGVPATGAVANLRVKPGQQPLAALRQQGPVLELLRFSTLEPHPVTGALSGEIRTGYFHKDGRSQPIKGGSLSTLLDEAFRYLTLSQETVQREAYWGPAGVRLAAVAISGG